MAQVRADNIRTIRCPLYSAGTIRFEHIRAIFNGDGTYFNSGADIGAVSESKCDLSHSVI